MSSWEEYKKKREKESSWARYKKQRESENAIKSNNVSRATAGQNLINSLPTSDRNRKTPVVERKTSLWENIQNLANKTTGVAQNLILGGTNGAKSSLNFAYKTGENRLKSQDEIERTRVLNSKDLTDNEKNTFILQQQDKLINKDNNDNSNVIKTILPTKEAKYDEEKVNQIASESVLDKSIREDEEKIQENIEKQTNPVLRKLAELAPSIGNMAVGTVLSGLNPGVGTSYFTTSAAGSYMQDALDRGMTQEEATNYGAIMGLMEGATEMIGVGNLSKAGKGIKTLIKGSSNNTVKETGKNTIKTVLKDYGIGIADNVMQESLIEPISEIAAGIIGGKDKANFENIGQRMLESGINGGLTSAIVGGANLGIQSCVGVIEKTRNGSTVTQEELKTAVKDASKQLDVEKMIVDSTQQQVGKYKANNNIENQQDTIFKEQDYYQYKQTNNQKINNLRKDMAKYWDNSQKTIDLGNTIEKIITDKNYNIRLDDSIINKNGQSVNAQIKTLENGEVEIKINPNSKNVGEFLIMHETTHAIGTQEMKNLVMDYASKNSEFNNALESLKQTYGVEDVSDEVLSDISAQLFGNQEFINNLSMQKPSIFKRIYNKIIELANKITGNSNEALFIKDLKNKWEEAYRTQNNNLDENTHFSVIYNNDGSFNRVKITDNIFENNNNKSITRTIKDYLTEHIGEYADIIESGQRVYLGEDLPGEYAFSKSTRGLTLAQKMAKGRATTGLKEIINNATNRKYSNYKKTKHIIDAKYGFYKYDTKFSFELNGKEQTYSGTVLIRNDANGKKYLYDILDIKKIGSNLPPVASNSKMSSANIGGSNSLPTNSIPPTKDNVNSDTTKYSMQESENNSDSFNLSENYFDVTDNENLNNASILFYNKREDGTYYVQATDNSGNFVYDGTFIDKRSLTRSLGEKIANKIVENAEVKYNNELYLVSNKKQNKTDYMMSHRPSEDGATADDISKNGEYMPKDVYEHPEWYFQMNEEYSKESFKVLKRIKGNPNAQITIYRATTGNEINDGDWVTVSKKYAEHHNEAYLNGKGKVISLKVKAKDIQFAGDDINEFGYFPESKNRKYSLPTKEWSEHLKENYKATGTRTNLEDIKLPTRKYINKMSLTDYLDARGFGYEIDEDGNLISVEDRQAVKDYFIEKHRYEARQKNQELKINDNDKTDLETFKEETNKLNLPTKENINYDINTELLTDEDYAVLNEIYEKEGRTEILTEKRKAKLLEKYANDKYTFKNSLDILAQKFINKGHFVDKLSEQTNNPELKFLYDRNLNSFAEGQYVIGVAQTDNDGNQIGKSINDIWKPVEDANQTKEFSEYLLHKLNVDRSERNKFVFGEEIGPTESTKMALDLENKHPEFKRYAQDIKNFNHNNLLNLKEAGFITQETIDYLEKLYPYYVPISRDKDGKTFVGKSDSTGTNLPIKKATGGNSDIQPIKDTMAQQAIRIKRLINQNKLGQELAKTLKNAKIEQQADIQYTPDALMEYDTLVEADNKGNKYYTYFEDGFMQKLKISDELYESLKPTEINDLEKTGLFRGLQKFTNIHRSLLTSSNPVFIVSNFFKDIQDGMFNSKYSSKFIKNYGKALHEIITKGKYYESYMANGGMTNTYFDYNEGIKNKRNKFVEKIRSTNEIVEQLPRLSEFISTLEDGKSLNEALYNAAEITTNFKRGGEITKAINRNGVNFLNASIQGLDKQFRNFSGQNGAKGYANLLLKATLLGVVPSVLNHILLGDDEDYEDLPESTKDLYYLFKYDDNKFIRIPKGRVLSIFGSSARRVLEALQGKENSFDGFTDTLINQMAPNNPLEDNILAPILQVKNNKTWYGEDLVSSRLQKELPKNQYDETTDEFSKWIGKQLNISPKKINYLIDQYSGGLGDVVLPMMTPQAKQNVFKDKFTTDSIMKNKNVSKFYETLEKQSQIANDSFATDEDRLESQYLNEISSNMSDLYKEKREIQMSDISNSEKTEKVREIQEKINELAEQGLAEYSNGTYKKNSAKIGDIEYYKDGKGEWTKLTEEEISKNKNISTETYATYKQKIYKETQSKRKSGELSENQNLKTADKIQILLDSNYSEKEIGAIYENYIKSENDAEYNIMKIAGIDTKEYLKYKQQEFTSDKKDDGTLAGKTVSKSKQKKVVEYLNSMKITGNQRLMLYAMQGYSTTSSQKKQLANYVQGLKLDKDTKLKLYDKFSGFKVYKDGRVTW